MKDAILGMVGLAARAGNIIYGTDPALLKLHKGALLLVAGDAGSATLRKIQNKTQKSGVPVRIYSDKFSLGKSVGKTEKAVLLITDQQLGRAILKRIDACRAQAETEVTYGEIK